MAESCGCSSQRAWSDHADFLRLVLPGNVNEIRIILIIDNDN